MAKSICSIDGCDKVVLARRLCVTHYHRWNRATKDERLPVGLCRGCGAQVPRNLDGPPKHYCSIKCRPRCSIDGCEKPRHGVVYCSAHHSRWRRTGDPLTPLTRHPNLGACSVEGCDEPMRHRTWCSGHYSQWRRLGEVSAFKYKWASETDCLLCGRPNGGYRSRKFCSAVCLAQWHRGKGVPVNPLCARCGVEIDLSSNGKGRRRRRDVKLCSRCRVQQRTEATPGELALRDGPLCQLCGCDVDLSAAFPDPMRPSVDHIIPRAWGGGDEASNNQLTHLRCNQIKSDRYEGVSSRRKP